MAFSQFGTNSAVRRKRVYYTESATTIREGMPVCYEFDATANVLHYDKGAGGDVTCQTSPTTTAEGNQNEGKFMRVEDPDSDNIQFFAGVVAGASYAGLTGPRWLDIYVPNGAIIPVRTDQNCTVGRTILAVHTAEQHLTGPYDTAGRPVAVACETSDLSGGAGLVLAKLEPNLFLYQKGDATRLLIDDQDTGNGMTVNYLGINSNCASGDFSNLVVCSDTATVSNHSGIYTSLKNTGTGAGGFHVMQVRGDAYGTAIAGDVNAVYAQIDLEASCVTSGGIVTGLFSKVHVKAAAGTISGKVVAGRFCLGLDRAITGVTSQLYFEHTTVSATTPDFLFEAATAAAIGGLSTGFLTASHGIRIRIGGAAYRILLDKE